ncbi:MAG: peptidylprolyl isomerase [Cyanobacteria bacterium P01_H01_bin.15]
MSQALKINEKVLQPEEMLPLLMQYRLVTPLVKEVLIDHAIANLSCEQSEIHDVQQKIITQQSLRDANQLGQWLKQQGLDQNRWSEQIERQIKLSKYREETWGPQIERYFLERKRQLDRVVYSLIRTPEAGIAQELYFRIQDGESDFTSLARQFSQGTEAQTGGLIGPVEMGTPHPRIGQLLNTAKPGDLIPPTRIENWWIILRLEKFIPAQLDDAMRQRLLEEKFQIWLRAQLQEQVSVIDTSEPSESLTSSVSS